MDMSAHINGYLKGWIIAQTNLPKVSHTRWTCKGVPVFSNIIHLFMLHACYFTASDHLTHLNTTNLFTQ